MSLHWQVFVLLLQVSQMLQQQQSTVKRGSFENPLIIASRHSSSKTQSLNL